MQTNTPADLSAQLPTGLTVEDAIGLDGSSSGEDAGGDTGDSGDPGSDTGGDTSIADQIRVKLNAADAAFREADEAQKAGNTVKWATLVEKGRSLVEEAVALSRQLPADPAPSGSASPSESASPSADASESPSS